jgi:hypothetical protein
MPARGSTALGSSVAVDTVGSTYGESVLTEPTDPLMTNCPSGLSRSSRTKGNEGVMAGVVAIGGSWWTKADPHGFTSKPNVVNAFSVATRKPRSMITFAVTA